MMQSYPLWRSLVIYVIVFLASFATLLLSPLKSQYLYKRIALSHNSTASTLHSCNRSNNDVAVQNEVSRWTLLLNISLFIPSAVAGVLITSWGDKVGRKVTLAMPVLASILGGVCICIIVLFDWPLQTLLASNFLSGLGGYYLTMLMQGVAYMSDVTKPEKRAARYLLLETCLGVGGGIAGLISGYWLAYAGFFPPMLCSTLLNLVAFLLIFLLPDSRKIKEENERKRKEEDEKVEQIDQQPTVRRHDDDNRNTVLDEVYGHPSVTEDHVTVSSEPEGREKYTIVDLLRRVWVVYSSDYSKCERCHGFNEQKCVETLPDRCIHGGGWYPGRVWRMWFYLLSNNLFMLVILGVTEMQAIYFLSEPLCFTPVLIGAQTGMFFGLIALAPFYAKFCQRYLGLGDHAIILLGQLGIVGYCAVMSIATHPYIVFIATSTTILYNPLRPFIQAQMSKLVSNDEQGACFALITLSQIIMFVLGSVTFLMMYPATLHIYHGFSWIIAAMISCLPIPLIIIVVVKNKSKPSQGEDRKLLISAD